MEPSQIWLGGVPWVNVNREGFHNRKMHVYLFFCYFSFHTSYVQHVHPSVDCADKNSPDKRLKEKGSRNLK